MRLLLHAAVLLLVAGCRNTPVPDGATWGPVVQVKQIFTSAFLAETGEGALLIDAGLTDGAKPLVRALEERGHDPADVSHVFITHGHGDHVGGLAAFPEARLLAHPDEIDRIAEEGPDVAITDRLADGDLLAVGDLEVEVFHVPGHTAGNLAFRVGDALVTGDSAMRYRDGTVGPVPDRFSEDPDRARRALGDLADRLADRGDELSAVAFSHSDGLEGDLEPFFALAP